MSQHARHHFTVAATYSAEIVLTPTSSALAIVLVCPHAGVCCTVLLLLLAVVSNRSNSEVRLSAVSSERFAVACIARRSCSVRSSSRESLIDCAPTLRAAPL